MRELSEHDTKNIWSLVWYILKILLIVSFGLYVMIAILLDDGWRPVVDWIRRFFMSSYDMTQSLLNF